MPPRAGAAPGRRLAYTVGVCLAGSGLALLAVTRVWSVVVTARPGLSDLRTARTGAAELPWLPALALVGLAGAGALLATRGWPRRAVGVLLALAGAGLAVGAVAARAGLDPGTAGAGSTFWPVVAVLGAALLVLGGWWAVRRGHEWPAMGARYERPATTTSAAAGSATRGSATRVSAAAGRDGDARSDEVGSDEAGGDEPAGAASDGATRPGQSRAAGPVDTRAAWDALDRGDDPTVR